MTPPVIAMETYICFPIFSRETSERTVLRSEQQRVDSQRGVSCNIRDTERQGCGLFLMEILDTIHRLELNNVEQVTAFELESNCRSRSRTQLVN